MNSTGLFTSPHIVSWRERIRLGADRSPRRRSRLASTVRPVVEQVEAEGLRPSFFEACTAMALLAFAEARPELCVVEVGLGGRLDATNVLTPLVAVITTLGREHTRVLGDTLEQIAAEKAGIIKPGVPVVVAPQEPGAAAVVARSAQARHAPLRLARAVSWLEPPSLVDPDEIAPGRCRRSASPCAGPRRTGDRAAGALLGAHQAINAGVAAQACEELRACGFIMSARDFTRGLEGALAKPRRPGRDPPVAHRRLRTYRAVGAGADGGAAAAFAVRAPDRGAGRLARQACGGDRR